MKTHDRGTSLFWLALSIAILVESFRLGIGTLRNPGMGFMAFGASGLLGVLSLILFLQTYLGAEEAKSQPLFSGTLWKRVLFVLVTLAIYARLMPELGYVISTFLLMGFLFWIVRGQKWWWVLISSFLTTMATYYVFSKWLNCQFPEGILGF
jgi:putative tricarboxylic transport membrane protein